MTTRETIHRIVDELSDKDAEDLLDWLNLRADPDELTPEEAVELARIHSEMQQGQFESLEDLKTEFDR